jgi:hypothetical protein
MFFTNFFLFLIFLCFLLFHVSFLVCTSYIVFTSHFSIVPSYYIFLLPPASFLFIGSMLQSSNLPALVDAAIYSTHLCSFCVPALHLVVYHGVALSSDFSPILLFLFCIHLLTTCFTVYFFLLSVFLSPAPVRNFRLPELFASKQHWCLYFPHPPTCINPIGWHQTTATYHCPHSSQYELCASVPCFLFGFLTLEDGTDRLSTETSVRNYHYLLCNNTEECSSYLLHGGNLKSHKNKTNSIENW